MNKIIAALEMEVGGGEDDDNDGSDDEGERLLKMGGVRAALDAQQRNNGVSGTANGLHHHHGGKNNISTTGTASSSSTRKGIVTIVLGVIVAIVALYGVLYQETTVPITPPGSVIENSNNNNDDGVVGEHTNNNPAPVPVHHEELQPKQPAVEDGKNNKETEPASLPNPAPTEQQSIPTKPNATTATKRGYMYSELSAIVPDPFHTPITDETRAAITEHWKKWKFWDGDEQSRPVTDYCGEYPNRDIPGTDFPDNAWQVDAVFVNHLINDAELLVARAKEAIFTEYGHGKPLRPEQLSERLHMFKWIMIKNWDTEFPNQDFGKRGSRGIGGYTTTRSWDGLVRRLLHAIMTNDDFTVVMGGHSAAAGHGNHFHQSYMMQFHKIIAPVLARLGVKLVTRNMGQGGLGTLHNAMGMKDIYGDNIDLLLWDSGMTEKDLIHIDLFYRQALLSGNNKVPVLWGENPDLLRTLHDTVDADVGDWGSGWVGVPETTNENQQSIPHAARYYRCDHDAQELCNDKKNRFCATCWIDRPDVNPAEHFSKIDSVPGSQVKWHPGWRWHQLTGRVLAFAVLDALQDAIQILSDGTMGGPPLDENWWHMTDYYKNIQTKARQYYDGKCSEIVGQKLPGRLCTVPMNARTHYTPRANPADTGLNSIIKPASDGYIPTNYVQMEYDGPDVHNPCFDIPEGEVDVLAIVSNRRRLHIEETTNSTFSTTIQQNHQPPRENEQEDVEIVHPYYNIAERVQRLKGSYPNQTTSSTATERQLAASANTGIIPGKGWVVIEEPPGLCDGTYNAICGRSRWITCPMIGHHDARGAVIGDEYAGWLVFNLPEVKHGIIILKIVTFMSNQFNWKTKDWTSVNNEGNNNNKRMQHRRNGSTRSFQHENITTSYTSEEQIGQKEEEEEEQQQSEASSASDRQLTDLKDYPDGFLFDYAIDGKITTLNKQEFMDAISNPQRVIEFIVLLDDPSYSNSTIPKTDVEVAIRMRNCARDCAIAVSHIYWA